VTRWIWIPFLALVLWTQGRVDGARRESLAADELYLRSGEAVKRVWAGLEGLGADVYWLRTVQHYGGQRMFAKEGRYPLLAPLLDATVSLDPRFDIAYKYGAIFLSEPPPFGAGDPRAGIALLERGARQLPDSWRMRQHLAFCTYLYLHDAEKASQILNEASALPGAPFWMKTMAAQILIKGGEHATARAIWNDVYRSAAPGLVQDLARTNLERLDAIDLADTLEIVVKSYHVKLGRLPASFEEIRAAGLLRTIPVDPRGKRFDYNPETGRVNISRQSPLWSSDFARY
jgi:hypothetical protein